MIEPKTHRFFEADSLEQIRPDLEKTPLFRPGHRETKCATTCYGGFAGIELYEPMPTWISEIRRRVELYLGVHHTHFNCAALFKLDQAGDCLRDFMLPPDMSGSLSRMALITLSGNAHIQFDQWKAKLGSDTVRYGCDLRAGEWIPFAPGAAFQWRMKIEEHALEKMQRIRDGSAMKPSWHLLFFHMAANTRTQEEIESDFLYSTFRYGNKLAMVTREPHLKLNLQIPKATSRQKLLSDFVKVKKEPKSGGESKRRRV
jgi:hypothetical protein